MGSGNDKQRPVTSFDVAREAGVSRSTVSVVLNNAKNVSVSPETYRKVMEAAEKLQYRPNMAARSISTQRAYSIGLVSCWEPSSPLFAKPMEGILDEVREADYALTLCELSMRRLKLGIEVAINFYREGRIDGVIGLMGTTGKSQLLNELVESLRHEKIPFVFVNSHMADPYVDDISTDNFHAGFLGTHHLIRLGHKRICFLTQRVRPDGERVSYADRDRLLGYQAAMQDSGLGIDPSLILSTNVEPISVDMGYRTFKRYLESSDSLPTGVYAISDHLAIGAIYAAQELGIKVPEDLAVVGTDDIGTSRYIRPPLTSVSHPLDKAGSQAVKLLLEKIDGKGPKGPVKMSLPCTLMVRGSCGGGTPV
jgi:LacI family repressor for deo operon, udp, cdd, tsx, nupC, and nupG